MMSIALSSNATMAADALEMKPTPGVPVWMLNVMDTGFLESFSGHSQGAYRADPDGVYMDFQRAAGVCMIDQYLGTNPLTMSDYGFEDTAPRTATTGAEQVMLDGICIDSPEAVVQHLEQQVFPAMQSETGRVAAAGAREVDGVIQSEREMQAFFGPEILKVPHGSSFGHMPELRYGIYGYVNYFMAYTVYPEIMERDFALQGELAYHRNRLAARAMLQGALPGVVRLDHDMADSKGTLIDVRTLDRIWFPHFAHAIQPYLEGGIRLLWHCDGNLMEMVPRLLEAGIGGFQGFQYEDGMDYLRLCRMTTRDAEPLMIWAGASVTRTLPFGSPDDVRNEIRWLAENGPRVGMFLGASSSITPGVPHENLRALIEALNYYRTHPRRQAQSL